jgi:hypothetical protein
MPAKETTTLKTAPSSENKDVWGMILLLTFLGLLIRLILPLHSSMPLNDGGLFYQMTIDLQQNGFRLPFFTTYNALSIPFAYPPLAFYLTAFLATFLHLSVVDVIRILPPIISALTIPAFFLLASQIQKSTSTAILSTAIFAFTPRAFSWLVMGGGITRAFGLLFALFTLYTVAKLYATCEKRYVLPAILWGALTVLTHPEAILQTLVAVVLLYLFQSRTRKGLWLSLCVAAGVILIAAPWWAAVLSRHGLDPFLAAFSTAGQDSPSLLIRPIIVLQFLFTDEPYVALVAALGMIGLFAAFARRAFLLPTWLFVSYILEPRGALVYMSVATAMLAGLALNDLVLPGLQRLLRPGKTRADNTFPGWQSHILGSRISALLLGFVILYLLAAGYATMQNIAADFTLQDSDLAAMDWVRLNTPVDSRFITLTSGEPMLDPTAEWFPALTGRQNLDTVFGLEWIRESQFSLHTRLYRSLQKCAFQDIACLQAWTLESQGEFTYVYIRQSEGEETTGFPITTALRSSPEYKLVYSTPEVSIFEKMEP